MLLVIDAYPAYISGNRFASPISEKPMANRLPIALLSLLLALPASALAQAPSSADTTATAAALPAVAFGTVPAIDNVTLSLDGKLLASAYVGKQVSITILDLVARKPRHRIAFDQNMKLRSMGFVDDTTLLANFSITYAAQGDPDSKSELGATFAINAEDGSSRVLMEARENNRVVPSSARVASRKGGGPGEILMTARLTDLPDAAGMIPGSATAYILAVNTKTGAFRPLEKGGRYTGGWLFDTEGRAQIRIDSQFREMAKEGTTTLRYRKGDDWVQFHEATGRDFNPVGLGADGKSVLVISALGSDRKKLWTIPIDGSGPQLLFQDPDHDVEGATTDRYDGRLLAVSIGGLEQRIHWLDADAEARQASVAAALPGRRVNVSGYSRDGRYAVAFAQSRTNPGAYFLVDFQTNRAEIVGPRRDRRAGISDVGEEPTGTCQAGVLSHPRRLHGAGLPDPPTRYRSEKPPGGHAAAWRTGSPRQHQLRLVVAVRGHTRVCRTATAVPWLYWLRRGTSESWLSPMGPAHARRCLRRREISGGSGHCGPDAGLHRRR